MNIRQSVVKMGKHGEPEAARGGCEIREIQRFIEILK
jgi:hypothetical protein